MYNCEDPDAAAMIKSTTTTTTTTTATSTSTDDSLEDDVMCNCMPGIVGIMSSSSGSGSGSAGIDSVFQGQALDVILVVRVLPTNDKDNSSDNNCNNNNNNCTKKSSAITIACNDFNVIFPGRQGIVRLFLNGTYVEGLDMLSTTSSSSSTSSTSTSTSSTSLSPKGECRFLHGHTKQPNEQGLQLLRLLVEQHIQTKSCPSLLQQQQQQQQQQNHHCPIWFHLLGPSSTSSTSSSSPLILGVAQATLFLWQSTDRIVACDIDGTITKSNVRGVWDTIVLERYDHVHPGVAGFLQELLLLQPQAQQPAAAVLPAAAASLSTTSLSTTFVSSLDKQKEQQQQEQVLRIVYLTSRPVSLLATTRKFLYTLTQQDTDKTTTCATAEATATTAAAAAAATFKLPIGPVFCSLSDLSSVLMSELLWKDIYRYKRDVLTSQIVVPFAIVHCHGTSSSSSSSSTTTIAETTTTTTQRQEQTLAIGFGNTPFDTMAYDMAGIPLECVYQINEKGMIQCFDQKQVHAAAPTTAAAAGGDGEDASSKRRRRQHPKCYESSQGSIFQGYTDPKLLQDIQKKLFHSCC